MLWMTLNVISKILKWTRCFTGSQCSSRIKGCDMAVARSAANNPSCCIQCFIWLTLHNRLHGPKTVKEKHIQITNINKSVCFKNVIDPYWVLSLELYEYSNSQNISIGSGEVYITKYLNLSIFFKKFLWYKIHLEKHSPHFKLNSIIKARRWPVIARTTAILKRQKSEMNRRSNWLTKH